MPLEIPPLPLDALISSFLLHLEALLPVPFCVFMSVIKSTINVATKSHPMEKQARENMVCLDPSYSLDLAPSHF